MRWKHLIRDWKRIPVLVVLLSLAAHANAHNLPYTLVEAERVDANTVELAVFTHVGPLVLDLPLTHLGPSGQAYLGGTSDTVLARRISNARRDLTASVYIAIDSDEYDEFDVVFPTHERVRRDAMTSELRDSLSEPIRIRVSAKDANQLIFAAPPRLGQIVLVARVQGEQQAPLVVAAAQMSPSVDLVQATSLIETIHHFLIQGIVHIVPLGLDHILFLLSLTVISVKARVLFLQVTGFTIAHTITLGMTVMDVIPSIPGLVEPLIALSIVAVAVHNIVQPSATSLRGVLIVALGLLHGLGFAGALRALGLPQGSELIALIAFNIGVEIGQIAVLATALLLTAWFMRKPWFYRGVTVPASLFIALIGSFWTLERIGFASWI